MAAAIDTQSVKTTESGGPSGYDAGKKVKGIVVDVEGLTIEIAVHPASVQDRDGAPAVIIRVLEKAPQIRKIWADSGYQGEKLASALKKLGIGSDLEIVKKPRISKGSPFSTASGSSSGPSLGCRAAGVWRRTASGAWRTLWRRRSWPRAAS